MRKLLLSTVAALALAGSAQANVILDPHLSGTGDNVVFDSISGSIAVGKFNGKHTGIVDFTDLSGNSGFTGASDGNDIKISNTSDLNIQVFTGVGGSVLDTLTQVFSLKGTGDVHATVTATDGVFKFDLGKIKPTAQSGFTFKAIDGESMSNLVLLDIGGTITDYEHYRIDVAGTTAATPLPAAGLMFAPAFAGMWWASRRRKATA